MTRLPRAAAVLLLPVLAACSSNAAPPAATPAEVLRVWDANTAHATTGTTADYQAAIDKVTPECTQKPGQLPAMVEATWQILVKGGVTDETGLTVLKHLADSIPAGSPPMDCAELLGAYATLRTG